MFKNISLVAIGAALGAAAVKYGPALVAKIATKTVAG